MESEETSRGKVGFLVNVAYWTVIIAIIYIVFRYLLRLLMPFFLALVFASVVRPIAYHLSRETKLVKDENGKVILTRRVIRLNRTVAGILSVVLLFAVMGVLLGLVVFKVGDSAANFISQVPVFYENNFVPGFNRIYMRLLDIAGHMDPDIREMMMSAIPNLVTNLGSAVTNFSAKAVSMLTSLATSLPSFLVNTMICMIATVFIAVDFDRIKDFIRKNLPAKPLRIVVRVKNSFLEMVLQFLKSYFIIFCITTAEIAVGLFVIRVPRPLLIALITATLDAFPIIGSGLVLIPWSIVSLVTGSYYRGIGILIIYILVAVIRQIIEPRIVGKHVGLRPLVTLVCMYAGTKIFGPVGLFALPIMAAILVDLNSNGVIHFFESASETQPEEPSEKEI